MIGNDFLAYDVKWCWVMVNDAKWRADVQETSMSIFWFGFLHHKSQGTVISDGEEVQARRQLRKAKPEECDSW